MKKSKYTFGYLFVKIAKLLSLLTVVVTAWLVGVKTTGMISAIGGIRYQEDTSLGISISRLIEEVHFTTGEVGRIAQVGDLPGISSVRTPSKLSDFGPVDDMVRNSEARRVELKRRAIMSFEKGVVALQNKIEVTVREIERVRQSMESAPVKPAGDETGPSSPSAKPQSALDASARSIFGQGNPGELINAREALNRAAKFFEELLTKAEKDENKRLIKGVQEEVAKLQNWLPPESEAPNIEEFNQPSKNSQADQTQSPIDPLENAIRTHRALSDALAIIRNSVTGKWTLDEAILETANRMEAERDQCGAAESRIQALRSAWMIDAIMMTIAGLAAAFVILVLADFIQSFFDTATNAGLILDRLEEVRKLESNGVQIESDEKT
jgi:hypothetical protein